MPSYQHHRVSFLLDGISRRLKSLLAHKTLLLLALLIFSVFIIPLSYCTGFSPSLSESPISGSIVPSNSTTS